MGILKQPTWWEDAEESIPPHQWEAASYPVTVEADAGERGEFTGTIKFPLGTPIELSSTTTPGDAYFANVSLLLHMDGSGFVDSSSYNNVMTNNGTVTYDTSIKKFGTGSAHFQFGPSSLTTPSGPQFDLSTGDWTIEAWVRFDSGYPGTQPNPIIRKMNGSHHAFNINVDASGHLIASGTDINGTPVYTLDGGVLATDVFVYVELDRHGNVFTLRVNGVTAATATSSAVLDSNSQPVLVGGNQPVSSDPFHGWIDELRVTKGIARYTMDFTPPTAAFLSSPPIIGVLPGGFDTSTVYYVAPSGDVNPLTFALAKTVGGVPLVATSVGVNVVVTDERYTFLSADTQIAYGGDLATPASLTLSGTARFAYQVITHASAGTLQFEYDIGNGPVDINLTNTDGAIGLLSICLEDATQLVWGLKSGSTGAIVAFQEGPADSTYGNVNFNCSCPFDENFETLAALRRRMMIRLGFAATADNPPPGMALLINDFLQTAQKTLYKKYPARFTRRFFKWDMQQGTRFYGVSSNTDDPYRNLRADFTKGVEWSGIEDPKATWTPIFEGIVPELYTMVAQLGRPVRYEIRECIEVFPAPDGPYTLWLKAHIALQPFASDGDETTIDSEAVFLRALALGKAHYGQVDSNATQQMADAYVGELCAGTHLNKTYIPGAHPQMPIVKPALIQFQNGG